MKDMDDNIKPKQNQELEKPLCSCLTDPFTSLPPELRPRNVDVMKGLRKVNCPSCGFEYWTNRDTDICIDCENKGVHLQSSSN